MAEIPDLRWYAQISERRGVPIRCPHATVEACPRYYQSLSLLGNAGSTAIPKAEDQRILKKWESSDLWPRTMEQATSVSGAQGNPSMFSSFCPEVAFERFGYFASSLGRYGDEIDSGFAHERLHAENAPSNDPRWSWAFATAQHYTECPIYSVLSHRANLSASTVTGKPDHWWYKHLWELVSAVVVAIAVAVLAKVLG